MRMAEWQVTHASKVCPGGTFEVAPGDIIAAPQPGPHMAHLFISPTSKYFTLLHISPSL